MPSPNDHLVVPQFKIHTTPDKAASKLAGRPIYKDMEVVEIRMAANKQTVAVFPAHAVWKWVDTPDGSREPMTYAMRFKDNYQKFKAQDAQAMSGTPLEELPFLTQAKRYELKAQNIYTAETLAAIDGQPLRNLGMGARELKDQAQAYLDKASGTAGVLLQSEEIATLKREIEALKAAQQPAGETDGGLSPFQSWEDEDLKNWLAEATGERPKGNPNHATLVRRCDEVNADLAKKAKEAA